MADTTAPPPTRGPNCWQCQHFAVSWDPRRPYACQRMGFKSPNLPAIEVLRIDGQPCRGFVAKAPPVASAANSAITSAPASSKEASQPGQWRA